MLSLTNLILFQLDYIVYYLEEAGQYLKGITYLTYLKLTRSTPKERATMKIKTLLVLL